MTTLKERPLAAADTNEEAVLAAPLTSSGSSRLNVALAAVLGALVAALGALAALWPVPASDLFWQLRTGELIAQTRSVPHSDLFSHTVAGRAWVVQDWLTDLLLALFQARVGPEALLYFQMTVLGAAFALVLWRCWARSGQPLAAVAVTVLAIYAARGWMDVQAGTVSYLFLALVLLLLDQWRLGRWKRAVWWIPAVMGLWANCHSGFLIGLAVLALETISAAVDAWARRDASDTRWRTLAGVLGASVVAGMVGPNGLHSYLVAPTLFLTRGVVLDFAAPWPSPNFHPSSSRPLELLLLGAVLGWGVSSRPRRVPDVLLVWTLMAAALYSTRHVPFFAIACAPIIAEHMGSRLRQFRIADFGFRIWGPGGDSICPKSEIRRLAAPAIVFAVLLGLLRLEWQRLPALPVRNWVPYALAAEMLPQHAMEYLRTRPGSGNLFNEYAWGSYCLAQLSPRQKVFIDDRMELYYQTKALEEYRKIADASAPGWVRLLEERKIDTVLVWPQAPLAVLLARTPGWRVVYRDMQAVVLRKGLRS